MERDDESGFIYIGARYYCPWLARWLEVEPLADAGYTFKNGDTRSEEEKRDPIYKIFFDSPYCYCENNPIKFVNLDGLKNIIYVINLNSGLSQSDMKKTIDKSNDALNKILGKENNIKVKELSSGDNLNADNLDKSDLVVVFGGGKDAENYIKQYSSDFKLDTNAMETTQGSFSAADVNVMKIEHAGLKGDLPTVGAWVILHSMGHMGATEAANQGVATGADIDGHKTGASSILRWDGQDVKNFLSENWLRDFESIDDALNNDIIHTNNREYSRNEGWISDIRHAFPTESGPAMDNYAMRQELNKNGLNAKWLEENHLLPIQQNVR